MRRVFAKLLDYVAIKTGIPIGGVLLMFISSGFFIWLISSPTGSPGKFEFIIAVAMWTFGYGVMWLGYGSEFWMNTGHLDILRKLERGELSEIDDAKDE